jgi:hypothetical protein
MSAEPTWNTLADYLIERFPELEPMIEESYLFWSESGSDPYPHFFLEEFLLPILVGREPNAHSDASRHEAGTILDRLLTSPDEDLASAALTAVLEMLKDSQELHDAALPFLGPTARSWLERLRSA